jgi:hypothetical protein
LGCCARWRTVNETQSIPNKGAEDAFNEGIAEAMNEGVASNEGILSSEIDIDWDMGPG